MSLDAMGALRSLLLADTDVTDLTSTRIYVNQIPEAVVESEDPRHPSKMVVLRMAGGSGKSDFLPTDDFNFDVLCYGESDFEADAVRRVIWTKFVYLTRETASNGVCFHHINPIGGPVSLVDPDIVWPAVSQGFTTKADIKE